jgi:RimJ/RimL family protein N-acetyltransferase
MISIPIVETERLILRGWRAEDLDTWARFMADPEVTRYLSGPQTRPDAWRMLATTIGHWELRGYGFWAVERKSDGALIGRIGLNNPEGWPGMEVGWTLGREYWGKGYAYEAAKVSMDYGFSNFEIAKLISVIHPENRNSQRLAERLGEVKGAPTELAILGRSFLADIWEITREKWAATRQP